jgi:xanthine dehydrogenase YagR molybdenum-binding subunit
MGGHDMQGGPDDFEITRRDLLKVGAVTAVVSATPLVAKGQPPAADAPVVSKVSFSVNGRAYNLKLDSRTSLLDAEIPHQEVVFLDEADPTSSPMKAKGIAELGICGVAAAVANAIYNATGVRVRHYPVTLDKLLDRLPSVS